MTNTERKLDEAKYFLGQLSAEDPYFDYILSAYLNAARSTTWIMRHEFCMVDDWENWFKTRQISTDQKELLAKINELRIASTKKDGVKTGYYFFDALLVPEEDYSQIKKFMEMEGELEITIMTKEEAEEQKKLTNNYVDDWDEEKISFTGLTKGDGAEAKIMRQGLLELTKLYFDFLNNQVRDCVKLYGKRLTTETT